MCQCPAVLHTGVGYRSAHLVDSGGAPAEHLIQGMRQGHHPLTVGHMGQHMVHQMRGHLRHPARALPRAHQPPLARQCHHTFDTARVAAPPHEPMVRVAASGQRLE